MTSTPTAPSPSSTTAAKPRSCAAPAHKSSSQSSNTATGKRSWPAGPATIGGAHNTPPRTRQVTRPPPQTTNRPPQLRRPPHPPPHQLLDRRRLARRDLQHQFVVDLQQHPRGELLPLQRLAHPDHRHLDDVRRRALDGS